MPTPLVWSESETAGRCHVDAQTLFPSAHRSLGARGNLLSGLGPRLHHSTAQKCRPPDVTFPADIQEHVLLLSVSLPLSVCIFSLLFLSFISVMSLF